VAQRRDGKPVAAPLPIEPFAEEIVRGLEKVYAAKRHILCEFEIDANVRFRGDRRPAGTARQPAGKRLQVGEPSRAC
jgi:hypothetical protein